ncbi:MAG TPA: hypothetical protein PLQ30_02615 [Rectinema sp.]|jgi:hypothetical protein|nr:hypothetical protein [Rectinema sp.]HPW01366.1 hypothetical protein [Rectinema sp.]HQN02440.1 hypothetical protein [Rectinema sp.]
MRFLPNNRKESRIKNTSIADIILLAAICISVVSCSSVPKEIAIAGIFDRFEKTPHVILRSGDIFLRDIAACLDDSTIQAIETIASDKSNESEKKKEPSKPIDHANIDKLLTRAQVVGIGVSLTETGQPALEAVFAGNFPDLLTSLSFSLDSNWKKINGGYALKSGSLYVRNPNQGQVHLATWVPPASPITNPGASALAARSGVLANAMDFAIYIDAKSTIVSQLPIMEGVTLPFEGILMSAIREKTSPPKGDPSAMYRTTFQIRMKDEQSARTYKPIVRFLWVMLSSKLSSYGIAISPEIAIEQQGSIFISQPVMISARQLVDVGLSISTFDN